MSGATLTPHVDVRRASERFKTRLRWLDSKHSFSFSRHYDPANTHHGLPLVLFFDIRVFAIMKMSGLVRGRAGGIRRLPARASAAGKLAGPSSR